MTDTTTAPTIAERLMAHAAWLAKTGGERLVEHDAALHGADLRAADLREADLREADLYEADLREADLGEANMSWADLREADMRKADMRRANLSEADLRDADLHGACLSGANLRGAALPEGYRIAILCFGGWPVTVRPDQTTIGCEVHPNSWWLGLEVDDRRLLAMDSAAPAWWRQHRETVLAAIRDVMTGEDADTEEA